MTKLDLFKEFKDEYCKSRKPRLIETTSARYLSITGHGEPGGELYSKRVEALYAMAFTIKMTHKQSGRDYIVAKMEGLWWGPDGSSEQLLSFPRQQWQWKMMIRTPGFITQESIGIAKEKLKNKGKTVPFDLVMLESFHEGTCVQALHIGPYKDETALIERMFAFANEYGYQPTGFHHEIYLSDPRRVEPDRLQTILRHPLKKA